VSEIRDALSTMQDIKAQFAEAGIYSSKRSISSAAMEGTANFPVLVDDSMSLDDSSLIARAAEKKFASFLLTVLTMDPYLEVEKGVTPSASAYMKQFHQNMRVSGDKEKYRLSLLDFVKESADNNNMEYTTLESEAFRLASVIYEGVKASIPQDINARFNYTVREMAAPDSLNARFERRLPTMEARRSDGDTFNTYNTNNVELSTSGGNVSFGDKANVTNRNVDVHNNVNVKIPSSGGGGRGGQWRTLTDNDCKKANDLVPTLLHVRVYPVDKFTKEELTPIDFVMGVKATLHPIPASEIARMVVSGMRNEDVIFNFIRWTTGEIKFFKDFMFALDAIKMDAKDSGNDVTGWRPALKRRAMASKSKLQLTKKSIMPNATLVISQSTIEYILENYGYDMSNEMVINRLMNIYFLLGYVIVNPVTQRATFRFDGIDTTDTYTYDTLRREGQNDDKAFKNMMKMLGRSM